jgi:hypothetical protein
VTSASQASHDNRLLWMMRAVGARADRESERARHLGNFPQAFSDQALLEAAARIIPSDIREELSL